MDSPVIVINASVAEAMSGGSAAALVRLDALGDDARVADYAPYHVARAEILDRLDRRREAAASYRRAIECGVSAPVEQHLEARLATCL